MRCFGDGHQSEFSAKFLPIKLSVTSGQFSGTCTITTTVSARGVGSIRTTMPLTSLILKTSAPRRWNMTTVPHFCPISNFWLSCPLSAKICYLRLIRFVRFILKTWKLSSQMLEWLVTISVSAFDGQSHVSADRVLSNGFQNRFEWQDSRLGGCCTHTIP